jgi:hypothetical protein
MLGKIISILCCWVRPEFFIKEGKIKHTSDFLTKRHGGSIRFLRKLKHYNLPRIKNSSKYSLLNRLYESSSAE